MGGSISEEQVALLREHCPNLWFVAVMLDGDVPGREEANVVVSRLARHWWSRIVHLPDGAQPDTIDRAELDNLLGRGEL
jgi:DNA primase